MSPKIIRNLDTSPKKFGPLSVRPIILKNIGLKGQHIISLPGATNYYPALGAKLLACRRAMLLTCP